MVFSFQEALSPHPADAANVALVLSPAAKPATPISSDNTVRLPVTISGLPPESLLLIDRAYIHLLGLDGTGLYRGRTTLKLSSHHDFVHAEEGGEVHTIQQIEFPAKIYELVRTRPVRAEIEFSLTLFQTEDTETMNPLNGDKRMAAFGWCKARVDDDGDEIQLGCIKPGAAPSCFGLELENPESGGRNPETLVCDPDYAPYALPFYPDAVSQFGGAVRFADKHGFANFPVDASQLPQATLMVQWYRPGAHFTRDAAAEIQPADWVLH
ncbi:MAG: hypothetical protein JO307_26680 [Bryobacterales bacterium]|nr:hypothetical protein [Bryobacterales bacterium]